MTRLSQLPCFGERVTPFEALDQPPRFGGRECVIERSVAVDIEVVVDQRDDLGFVEVGIGQAFQDMSIIHRGVAIGDLDVASAFERCEHHKEIGCAVTFVLVVATGRTARFHRDRHARLGDELLRALVQPNQGSIRQGD